MQTLTDAVYDDCVICLNKRRITAYCIRCNVCKICLPCQNDLVESGQMAKCPTCRLESPWISTHEVIIQEPFSPRAHRISHEDIDIYWGNNRYNRYNHIANYLQTTIVGSYSPRPPPPPRFPSPQPNVSATRSTPVPPPPLPAVNINTQENPSYIQCNACVCLGCMVVSLIDNIFTFCAFIINILKSNGFKKFICLLTISYLIGLAIVIVFSGRNLKELTTSQASWISLLIGMALMSGVIYACFKNMQTNIVYITNQTPTPTAMAAEIRQAQIPNRRNRPWLNRSPHIIVR